MTDKTTREGTGLDAFGKALETFGSDRTRWPAPVRRDFAGLLATSADAQARMREAEALDRLLDLAPPPTVDTSTLASRILAAAAAEGAARAPPAAAPRSWSIFERRSTIGRNDERWPAAALLAASLVLGTIFGFSGLFPQPADTTVAEASFDPDMDPARIAYDSSEISMFEGDLL
ncbi:hypothetical protein [Hyphomicrobium sp.]|uniref:hypothetical protein n=1 Tax=Hyphomicrobium sp. TaxID=82 RepID=UPI003F6FBF20